MVGGSSSGKEECQGWGKCSITSENSFAQGCLYVKNSYKLNHTQLRHIFGSLSFFSYFLTFQPSALTTQFSLQEIFILASLNCFPSTSLKAQSSKKNCYRNALCSSILWNVWTLNGQFSWSNSILKSHPFPSQIIARWIWWILDLKLNLHFSSDHPSCCTDFLQGFPTVKQCFPARAILLPTTFWVWANGYEIYIYNAVKR